jgi:TolB protein
VNPDGAGLRRLTHTKAWEQFPAWSPDGRRIAFLQSPGQYKEPLTLHVMNADGSGDRTLSHISPALGDPAWAPDGREIAFGTANGPIQIVSIDGKSARRLVSGGDPDWSSDGRMIAFDDLASNDIEIFVVRADGSGRKRLTHLRGPDGGPAWSPDAKIIAFQHGKGTGAGADVRDIYFMNADGSAPRPVLKGAEACDLDWAPDGKGIAFTGPGGEIYVASRTKAQRIVAGVSSCGVSWQRLARK